jgi:hypothetical protein
MSEKSKFGVFGLWIRVQCLPFYLFWVWYYIWLQALTGFMCLWNVSPFTMLTPLFFFVCICTSVCVCASLRQCV